MTQRVVITGMGIISPLGNDVDTFWNNLLQGKCGIGPIDRFDPAAFKVKLAAQVRDFDPLQYMDKMEAAHADLYSQYAMAAACQAVADSGIAGTLDAERVGVYIGSGIGGGTLGGLCHKLVGMERFGQIKKLAESGNLDHVDLTMKDITVHSAPTLDPDMTAANFGNLAEDASPADLAAGAVNLVLQAIGTMTVLACQCCDSKTVVLTGSMTTLPQAVTNFQLFEKLYGIHYIIPENATFATAIGAGLYSLQKKPEA